MEEIFRSETVVVTREAGFIRLRRTSQPLAEAGQHVVVGFAQQFRLLVPLRERKHMGLLFDARAAPMVGDDSMFLALRPVMIELTMGFAHVAILVQTALGKLQATRRSRSEDLFGAPQLSIFDDEANAIAYLTGRKP